VTNKDEAPAVLRRRSLIFCEDSGLVSKLVSKDRTPQSTHGKNPEFKRVALLGIESR
jgi:hypothetical protein